jgi:arylsulfatase A-like enzyme
MYEGGVRVPMIVRWPGRIKPSSESDHISAFWDILPTLAEAAGIKMTWNIDGISFLPELLGKKQKEHKYLYWEFHEQGGKTAVRMGKWKGVKRDIDKNPQAKTELYDLSVDTGETTDISGEHPDIIEEIESIMSEAHVTSEIFPFAFEKSAK